MSKGGDFSKVIQANALNIPLKDESVQCVICSPPYWGLRDYGTATWEGGENGCDHTFSRRNHTGEKQGTSEGTSRDSFAGLINCRKCGAKRIDNQLGLEKTPEEFVENCVKWAREVWRVLRNDGTFWLNLGDSYNGSGGDHKPDGKNDASFQTGLIRGTQAKRISSLKPKDLCGIPWKVAFALQADGWWLRSAMPWVKRSSMPESCTDRPASALEYMFLFAKGQYSSSTIKLSDLQEERVHFGTNFGLSSSYSGAIAISISLATSILDLAQFDYDFSLSSFDSKIGQQPYCHISSDFVTGIPDIQKATVLATRFLCSRCSSKDFLSQLNGLGLSLHKGNILLIGRDSVQMPLPPGVHADGKTAITIHHSGQICKFDFIHNHIIIKKPRSCNYYFDMDAIRISHKTQGDKSAHAFGKKSNAGGATVGNKNSFHENGRNFRNTDLFYQSLEEPHGAIFCGEEMVGFDVNPQAYSEAHFATFPEKIPEICIKAGTSEKGACPECGAPWIRVTKSTEEYAKRLNYRPFIHEADVIDIGKYIKKNRKKVGLSQRKLGEKIGASRELINLYEIEGNRQQQIPSARMYKKIKNILKLDSRFDKEIITFNKSSKTGWTNKASNVMIEGNRKGGESLTSQSKTIGWQPTCKCRHEETVPCVVLDPFAGAFTTKLVAQKLGRRGIGLELKWEYIKMGGKRCKSDQKDMFFV